MSLTSASPLRVCYAEADQMGVAGHGNVLVVSHSGARVVFEHGILRDDTGQAAVDGRGRPRRLPDHVRRLLA